MPYIKKHKRPTLESVAAHLGHLCQEDGDLNFAMCQLMLAYIKKKTSGVPERLSYQLLKDTWTTGMDASLEFRHRVQNVYEQYKIDQNGDIFEYILESIRTSQT